MSTDREAKGSKTTWFGLSGHLLLHSLFRHSYMFPIGAGWQDMFCQIVSGLVCLCLTLQFFATKNFPGCTYVLSSSPVWVESFLYMTIIVHNRAYGISALWKLNLYFFIFLFFRYPLISPCTSLLFSLVWKSKPSKKVNLTNKPDHGSVWSRPKTPPLVRSNLGQLVQTMVWGTFNMCYIDLDQTKNSESLYLTQYVWKHPQASVWCPSRVSTASIWYV